MNASPLPVAEFVPVAPGTTPASPGAAAVELVDPQYATDPAANPRGAADFAALLQSAGFAAEVAAEDTVAIPAEATPVGAPAAAAVSGAAIDAMLFLATVQAQPAPVVLPTADADAEPQSAEQATQPGASPLAARVSHRALGAPGASPLAARVPHRALVAPDTAALPRALDAVDPALVDKSPSGPAFVPPLAQSAKRPELEADPPYANPVADASSARPASRVEPRSDPAPAFVVASTVETAKRPVLETVAPELKPVAAASSAEPTASLAPPTSAASLASVTVQIDTPVHQPAWRAEAASRIATLVTRGIEHAELRVTPPELGPIEMRIDVRGGEATLVIVATHATTRDALEQALPLLREMLAQQGLSLGQATVQDGRAHNQAAGGGNATPGTVFGDTPSESTDANALNAPRPGLVRRLIDVFA